MKVEEKRRLKKIAIMEAALDVWSCDNFNTTSLTILAEQLHMTKPALYRYFKSKNELLDSMGEYVNSLEDEWFLEMIPKLEKEAPEKRIRFFIELYATAQVEGSRYIHFSSFNTLRKNELMNMHNMEHIKTIQKILDIPDKIFLLIMLYCFFMWGWHETEHMQQTRTHEEKIELIMYLLENGLATENFRLPTAGNADATARIFEKFKKNSELPNLMQAITQVIQENGFTGVTLELIAEKAGMSKSTLYNYFKNKDDMLTKTINVLVTEYTEFHAQLLSKKKSFEEKLLAHLELQSVLFPQKPQAFIVLKQFLSPDVFSRVNRPAFKKGFLNFLQDGIDDKKLRNNLSIYEYQMIFSFFIFIERVIYPQEDDAPLTEEILDWLRVLAYGYNNGNCERLNQPY